MRGGRLEPVLTQDLLTIMRTVLAAMMHILLGNHEFAAKASSMSEGIEDNLCIAVEQSINLAPVMDLLAAFSHEFPHVTLEILTTGPNDTATSLKEGRAVLGLMTEQESYPTGFQFRGVGHSALIPICSKSHPLAKIDSVTHRDFRQHRQLVLKSRSRSVPGHVREVKSASIWYAESSGMILDLVLHGLGWAELPLSAVRSLVASDGLVQMEYAFQQSDALDGLDLVWTEQQVLGQAGQWIQNQLLMVPQDVWQAKWNIFRIDH
ncbi:hypothetical protein RC74_11385 [Falsihalocynthiibacter arcticus]|uniref:LysR substrate-binding domain-containing protein n=2 Tax=Falsihalocynthiibacter arcticus TaxID=1579316 RepID=A0A126V0C9_9RHOB|nr:hypothetical protein RC74_11385 [Falsihalocynthiibacter arcticus]